MMDTWEACNCEYVELIQQLYVQTDNAPIFLLSCLGDKSMYLSSLYWQNIMKWEWQLNILIYRQIY